MIFFFLLSHDNMIQPAQPLPKTYSDRNNGIIEKDKARAQRVQFQAP
jgi:hypothetical protein